jgi:hypothetical protein
VWTLVFTTHIQSTRFMQPVSSRSDEKIMKIFGENLFSLWVHESRKNMYTNEIPKFRWGSRLLIYGCTGRYQAGKRVIAVANSLKKQISWLNRLAKDAWTHKADVDVGRKVEAESAESTDHRLPQISCAKLPPHPH